MKRDRITGWRAIERIDVGIVRHLHVTTLCATRWLSPAGVEATVVTSKALGRADGPVPVTVSAVAVARDAGIGVGEYVVDPQLRWCEADGRRFVVSPALGLRLSVPVAKRGLAGRIAERRAKPGVEYRVGFALVEALSVGEGLPSGVDGRAEVDGRHPALVTRWPLPATSVPDTVVAPATRPTRLAAGPAAFLRDDVDDPVPV